MAKTGNTKKDVVRTLLDEYGHTFADEAGINVGRNTPSPLFRLLCLSILLSARISSDIAVEAARALAGRGWTTARKMADSTWAQRAKTLNEAGYARYDERTSTMLDDTAALALDRYGGDLRKLRDEADRDPAEERKRLKQFKGMGDVGVDIFFREVQVVWGELAPFADDRVLKVSKELDLGGDAQSLARHAQGDDFVRLVAALMRVDLEGKPQQVIDRVLAAA